MSSPAQTAASAVTGGGGSGKYIPAVMLKAAGQEDDGIIKNQRTCVVQRPTSALPPIAGMCGATRDVCFGSIAPVRSAG